MRSRRLMCSYSMLRRTPAAQNTIIHLMQTLLLTISLPQLLVSKRRSMVQLPAVMLEEWIPLTVFLVTLGRICLLSHSNLRSFRQESRGLLSLIRMTDSFLHFTRTQLFRNRTWHPSPLPLIWAMDILPFPLNPLGIIQVRIFIMNLRAPSCNSCTRPDMGWKRLKPTRLPQAPLALSPMGHLNLFFKRSLKSSQF